MSGFHSYKKLFKIKWRIYSLGKYQLPRPIPLDALGLFFLFIVPAYFLAGPFAEMFETSRIATTVLVNLILTSCASKFDPQGRPFLEFLYDIVIFLIKNKQRDFVRQIPRKRKHKLKWESLDLE